MKRYAAPFFLALAAGCSCDDPAPTDGNDTGTIDTTDAQSDGGASSSDAIDFDGSTSNVRSLAIDPNMVTLRTDGTTPVSQTFTVTATYDDNSTADVTPRATLELLDPTLGAMNGATFTTDHGGNGVLRASFGGRTADAMLRVEVVRIVIVDPAPQNSPDIFGNAPNDPSRAPSLVYPNDGVMLPPNLGGLEFHFKPRNNGDLFELRLESALGRILIYSRCTVLADGCSIAPDQAIWRLFADTHRGRGIVAAKIRATDDQGTGVGESNTVTMEIAARPAQGGLYYWTTSNGTGIMRVDFGAQNVTPERYFPFGGNGGCFGCHALSRNGRKMTLSRNGINQGQMRLIDVAAQMIVAGADDSIREQFQSWNPTSDRFVAIFGDDEPPDTNLRIRDGDSAGLIESIPLGVEPTHPDWSPAGDRIAFTEVTIHSSSQRPGRGGISYVVREASGQWSALRRLVDPEDGKNRYYPAYSPDGQFLVFDESTCAPNENYNGDCDGDADPSAKLWAIPSVGGNRIELARANAPGLEDEGRTDLSNTFPKWAPFADARRSDGTGRVMWMTFSSRRQYGLRSPSGSNQLLWMVAVDPDAIARGEDGSFAAFALPFQDLSTSNHIAQWAAVFVPPSNPDGGVPDSGEGSDGGPDPAGDGGTCGGLGDPCDPANSGCCNGLECTANGANVYVCRPPF